MDFANMTNLQINWFYLLSPSGAKIDCTIATDNNTYIELTPTAPLTVGVTYTPDVSGRVRQADGTMAAIAPGTWTFTVQSLSGSELLNIDFSSLAAVTTERVFTTDEVVTLYESPYLYSSAELPGNNQYFKLSPDPIGSGGGNMQKTHFPIDFGGTNTIFDWLNKALSETELYIAFDLILSAGYKQPPGNHVLAFLTQNFEAKSTISSPAGQMACAFQLCGGGSWIITPPGRQVDVDCNPGVYFYNAAYSQRYFYSTTTPDYNSIQYGAGRNSGLTQINLSPAIKYRIKMRAKVNTSGSVAAPATANGICQLWVDNVLTVSKTNMLWRDMDTADSTLVWNRIQLMNHIGGDANVVGWHTVQAQDQFMDRIIVDTSEVF